MEAELHFGIASPAFLLTPGIGLDFFPHTSQGGGEARDETAHLTTFNTSISALTCRLSSSSFSDDTTFTCKSEVTLPGRLSSPITVHA